MTRFLSLAAVLAALVLSAETASAQHCRGVVVNSRCSAPVVTGCSYSNTYVAPVYSNTYVGVPVAVYVVPGTPTVALNVYPGQFTVVQQTVPPPVNVTVNVNGSQDKK